MALTCYICSLAINRTTNYLTCCGCKNNIAHSNCITTAGSSSKKSVSSWKCNICSPSNFDLLSKIDKLFDLLSSTNEKIDRVVAENVHLREQLCLMESRMVKLESDQTTNANVSYSELFNKLQDRQSREKNIMILNVPESINDVDDTSLVNDILVKIDAPVTISQLVRLGKIGPKPQPIKITCDKKSDVGLILKSKHRLRNLPDKKFIHLTVDMTTSQRSFYNKVREQLSIRTNNGENNIYIGYIKGVPTILQKS